MKARVVRRLIAETVPSDGYRLLVHELEGPVFRARVTLVCDGRIVDLIDIKHAQLAPVARGLLELLPTNTAAPAADR
jgi:hypothetical protein